MSNDEVFLVEKAKKNLEAVELLIQRNFLEIAASRIYYSMFYLAEALLQSRALSFSSHSAVIAAFGKEFSRTGVLDPKFHQYLIKSQVKPFTPGICSQWHVRAISSGYIPPLIEW
jgi:uncharacterized protein (UPF0332 family)